MTGGSSHIQRPFSAAALFIDFAAQALASFDTVFAVDDSASMTMFADSSCRETRWQQVGQLADTFVKTIMCYDADGIDMYFFNHRSGNEDTKTTAQAPHGYYNLTDPGNIYKLLNEVIPGGTTPTDECLSRIITPYLAAHKNDRNLKPLSIIVPTDGAPDDKNALTTLICRTAETLAERDAVGQIGIQFLQIGTDLKSTLFLDYLDNNVPAKIDIVDTVRYSEIKHILGRPEAFFKVACGAMIRRLDALRVADKPAA